MAIYRKGAASLDQNGIITGVGTNWKTSLSLIRPGATMVFASNPAVYVTISEIVSDTELRAVDTGRKIVSEPVEYVIFLHDSLTVDGLAQDVAETLRYYQGKENQFAHFIEVVKNLDIDEVQKVVDQMKEEVIKFEDNYKKIQQTAQEIEDNANDVKSNLQLTNAAVNLAQQYRDEAEEQKNQAQQHASEAAQSVDDAKAQVQLAANQVGLARAEVQKAKDVVAGAKTEVKQEVSDIVANAKIEVQQEAAEIVANAKEEVKQEASGIVNSAKQEVIAAGQAQIQAATDQADRAASEREKAEQAVATAKTEVKQEVTDIVNAAKQDVVAAAQEQVNSATEQASLATSERQKAESAAVDAGNKAAMAEEQSEMAQIAANEAERQANASEASRAKAEGEANRAQQYAEEIKDIGLSMDVTNLVRKDKNLEELTDKEKARENLALDRFHQDSNMTRISSEDPKTEFRLGWSEWGVYRTASDSERGYVPLSLKAGGTGANTAADARVNLQLERFRQFGYRTEIWSENGECRLFVNDNCEWGVLDKKSSYVALPISAGGTGAKSIGDARKAFKVDLLDQRTEETALMSPDKDHILTIRNDGTWGVWNRAESKWISLPIDRGGTGAATVQEAKANLQVDRLTQNSTSTTVGKSGGNRLAVNDSGEWGALDGDNNWIALAVGKGGTGAKDADGARANLHAFQQKRNALTANDNLDDIRGYTKTGYYHNAANVNATTANNYPIAQAGVLLVTSSQANGVDQTTQEYYPFAVPTLKYVRAYNRSNNVWSWSKWTRVSWAAGDWLDSIWDAPGEGVYRIKGDGHSSPTVGTPSGSGNNILNIIVSEVYSNAWLLMAYSGGNGMWFGRFNPQDKSSSPVWTKIAQEGGSPEFYSLKTRSGIEAYLNSDDSVTPAPSLVSRRGNAAGATIVTAEMRANYNGSVEWIKRDSGGTPRSIQITSANEVQFNSLVPVPANIELGKVNANSAAYIDFHYGAKYDYDARIICDGYNTDQNGGGNLRFAAGYMPFSASGGFLFGGGRLTVSTSDVNIDTQMWVKKDAAPIVLQNKTTGYANYILAKDVSSGDLWYVGRGGNNNDMVSLHNYKFNTAIQLRQSDVYANRDFTSQGNMVCNGSSIYVDGGSGTANTHLWLRNTSKKNRAVIYAADNQILYLRADNPGTGASGKSMSWNGSSGALTVVSLSQTSDERAKFWIKPVTGALDKICELNGVTFSMHTTIQNTVRNAGVIAQDVQKVLPEAVTEHKTDKNAPVIDKNCQPVENPLSVDYNALSALYVEAFKEVKELIDAQKSEIEALKTEIAELKAKA